MKKPPSTTTGIYKSTLAQLRQCARDKGWSIVHTLKIAVENLAKGDKP